METMAKPYVECYMFDDPLNVYDLTGYDPTNKLYRLENDHGRKRFVRYFEFCPISAAGQEEIEAGDDGRIYTVQQLVDAGGDLKWVRPVWAQEGPEGARPCTAEAKRPEVAAKVEKPKESQAKAQGEGAEVKEHVRELLAGATDRQQMAVVASQILGEDAHDLVMKYAHLDNGRYRMTLGNRMVGILKKA